MQSRLALGIDFGTSGTRACIVNPDGIQLAQAIVSSYTTSSPHQGWREQQPEAWWKALTAVVNQLPADLRAGVTNMVVDGTSGTILLCDSQGIAAGPALMYDDCRALQQAALIRKVAPDNSGAHGASSSLAKWLWLLQMDDEASGLRPLHQADWIANRLCNTVGFSDYNNALKLGYDPVSSSWPDWLSELDLPIDLLPEILKPGRKMGIIAPSAAKLLGLPEIVTVRAGTTDSIAAFISTGAKAVGQAVTSLGSTLVTKVISERPVYAPEFGVYSHKFGNSWLVGGASNSGGAALLKHFSVEEIRELSEHINPEKPTGLNYYPLAGKGERFPINDPDMQARLEPAQSDPVRFLQGLLEGIARIERQAYQTLQELGAPYPEQVYTAGGGAKNQQWRIIRENLLRCPVIEARHSEAAYGAALLALRNET